MFRGEPFRLSQGAISRGAVTRGAVSHFAVSHFFCVRGESFSVLLGAVSHFAGSHLVFRGSSFAVRGEPFMLVHPYRQFTLSWVTVKVAWVTFWLRFNNFLWISY